ncbi:MAG: hypothetical protein K6A05_01105 [Lachnospiraceae bacterium]|nr:hypothetical protein [Lachnospiraceae bacterium]
MGKHFLKKTMLPIYVMGHAIQFAVLFLCGVVINFTKLSILSFARGYLVVSIVVGIFCVILTCREWKDSLPDWKPGIWNVVILLGELGMMGGSILLLMPHWLDMTEESLYQLSATGQLDDMGVLLYGVLQQLTGMNPITLVRVFLPIFFLPLFYDAYHSFANGRVWYLVFAYMIFGLFIFVPGYIGLEVFLNIWNPTTLVISVFLPVFFVCVMQKVYLEAIIVALAMQGLMHQAWLYILFIVIVAVGVQIGYRISDKKEGKKS